MTICNKDQKSNSYNKWILIIFMISEKKIFCCFSTQVSRWYYTETEMVLHYFCSISNLHFKKCVWKYFTQYILKYALRKEMNYQILWNTYSIYRVKQTLYVCRYAFTFSFYLYFSLYPPLTRQYYSYEFTFV